MSRVRAVLVGTLVILAITAGSATAGALIGSARIKDGTVARVDVRNGSLTGAEVRDGSLRAEDLTGLEGGAPGPAGPPGDPGADGAPGLRYRSVARELAQTQRLLWVSECELGETLIAGGVSSTRPDLITVVRSYPDRWKWVVEVVNGTGATVQVYAWALCVTESS